ncbi:hypothetical protein [Streptomyces xantholiticus]|uniref:hypothetical protein n=1 Tax=Streptomyces xantholiticus TaxID=68285 RepID=UPI001E55F43C|nr:hypothetical protein [Streptomyces xantholiticus]
MDAEHGDLGRGFRVPQPDRAVAGDGCEAAAVGDQSIFQAWSCWPWSVMTGVPSSAFQTTTLRSVAEVARRRLSDDQAAPLIQSS